MAMNFVEFERPIAELEAKIEELRLCVDDEQLNISSEIDTLKVKCEKMTESIFSKLTPIQVTQLARHPDRPYTLDYIDAIFTDFEEMHGDRNFGDDPAIVGGVARFNGEPCMVIGHQKGRDTREKVLRNFGMPKPEGYRKALRLMETAERFQLPLFTFVDTPGAYPGIDAEERGQSQAIAKNLYVMSQLKVPIVTTVIGEGGSGGALALAVADHVLMLQYAVYAVISPEGCAAILWRDATSPQEGAEIAAENLGITADRLLELDMIDEVVSEGRGGCHRNRDDLYAKLRSTLAANLTDLQKLSVEELVARRNERLMQYGKFTEN